MSTEVLDGLAAGDEIDAVERIAAPIPVAVIAELLGIADGDRSDFRRWSDAIIEISDNPGDEAVMAAAAELFAFLDAHVRERMAEPQDDLISMLVGAEVGGAPLTHAQVLMFCLTLLVAGNETTRSLLSGGMLALAEHPDQRAALAADPSLLGGAVEECLRWVTPIQAFCRTTTQPVELGGAADPGRRLPRHALRLGQPGRDGLRPDRPVVRHHAGPPTPAHVAFGFGEHLCLGAALARLEAKIVFEELLRAVPGLRRDRPADLRAVDPDPLASTPCPSAWPDRPVRSEPVRSGRGRGGRRRRGGGASSGTRRARRSAWPACRAGGDRRPR